MLEKAGNKMNPKYVKMKPLRELVTNKIIEVLDASDDGESITFKVLPNGPIIRTIYSKDKLLVVDCNTVHADIVGLCPGVYEEC